ncbi:MAG: hypothetical protein KC621_09645 [Myxococcales bacterium]|nr:hypothetical protein [Myxococcales bacterium]
MPLPETVAMSVFPLDMQVALPELEGPLRHVPRGPAVQIELERLMIEGMVTKDRDRCPERGLVRRARRALAEGGGAGGPRALGPGRVAAGV